MAQAIRRPNFFDILRLMLVGSIWGSSFIFITLALDSFAPVTIAAVRVGLAALVLLMVCAMFGQRLPSKSSDWRKLGIVGIFNSAIPFFLISWGQQFVSTAEAALLMATGTFFALIISHFSTEDERINLSRALGVGIGFAGVLALVFVELIQSGLGQLKGQISVIAAGASYAVSSVLARRISHLPSISSSAGIMLMASCYLIPFVFLIDQPWSETVTITSMLAVSVLGIVSTAFAFAIRFTIIRDNGAVFMSQVGYLVPLFGVFWSWVWLSESITLQTAIALICILLGLAITRRGAR